MPQSQPASLNLVNSSKLHCVGQRADITFHGTLPPAAHITADSSVLAVYDKGKHKGAVFRFQTVLKGSHEEPLAGLVTSYFARGDGGFGGPAGGPPEPNQMPCRAPDRVVNIPTRPDQGLIYRLCGDRHPLHSDPESAKQFGFRKPILHGMCTYGITCRGILQTYADYDLSAFRRHARFSSPLYPRETMTLEMCKDGNVISFEASVKERGVKVVKNGMTLLD